ncbi:MAG: EamA/RhaT family transporter [Bacteroidetes bacterium]|nr:MAG: EamA/RhaT family transporter [Bacteroidota bacterium]
MKKQNKAYLFALAAVLLWSTVATAFKIALEYVDFIQLLLFASGIASLSLFIIILLEKKLSLLKKLSVYEWIMAAVRGFLNPFLYYLILFKAYDMLPAQEAMTLNYTWPIVLILLSIPLLKQHLSWKGMMAILLSFVGVIIIATKGNLLDLQFSNLKGDLLALSTSIVWAFFWIINLKCKTDESIKLFLSFGFGFLFTLPVVYFFSDFIWPSWEGILSVTYVGVAEMGLTFFLWLNALKNAKRTDQVSQLIYLSPFLSLIFISFILNEAIHFTTFIGLMFILAGIIWHKKTS